MTTTSVHRPSARGLPTPLRDQRPGVYRWSRAVYEQAVAAGVFDPQGEALDAPRVELLNGEIVTMPPHGPVHASALDIATDVLRDALAVAGITDVRLRSQTPIALDNWSEPEPDFFIVRGKARDFLREHPSEPLLVIEISDATLRRDRTRKRRLYARNGVPEYWLLNLRERVLEVMREPSGDDYASHHVHGATERVESATLPGLVVAVADLLP